MKNRIRGFLFLGIFLGLIVWGPISWASDLCIRTVVGTQTTGNDGGGDGGPASKAKLDLPTRITFDSSGNLYISDSLNYVIRRVVPDRTGHPEDPFAFGTIGTVAGNRTKGHVNGAATTAAEFDSPQGLVINTTGDLFVADSHENLIRKISGGLVSDLTTAVFDAPEGMTIDADGNLYVADDVHNQIKKVTPAGVVTVVAGKGQSPATTPLGDGGPATEAALNRPQGVAVDSEGNIYIADDKDHLVRKATRSDGKITTIAGKVVSPIPASGEAGEAGYSTSEDGGVATSAKLNRPYGLAVDSSGNVYVSMVGFDSGAAKGTGGDVVRLLSKKADGTYTISTVAGTGLEGFSGDGGPAKAAQIHDPMGMAIDPKSGNLLIADSWNYRIRELYTGPASGGCCMPFTCASMGKNCGFMDDGCGGKLNCGACNAPQTCGGAGVVNVCGGSAPVNPAGGAPATNAGVAPAAGGGRGCSLIH